MLLAWALLAPHRALARDAVPAPRLVWAAGARVYVAAGDSGALAPHMLVRVLKHGREIARGEVTAVLDGAIASVRLTSGGLGGKPRLERFEVQLEPAPLRPVATLRVGLPAPGREALAPPCAAARLDASALPRAYRTEPLADGGFRLVAVDSIALATPWPDTLLVRAFGDRADEEIALERGELDLAVFWPGEPSSRMRARATGFELLRGVRARGAVIVSPDRGDTSLVPAAASNLAALNAELFAGDLLPWSERAGAATPAGTGAIRGADAGFIRYRVHDFSGAEPMMRFLNRNAGTARVGFGGVEVAYRDLPVAPADSSGAGGRPGETPLFALRCPVLCAPGRAADIRALGADRFANLVGCGAGARRP
jgi:hypothetical protein